MALWMQERISSQLNMSPSQRVVTESRKAPVSTVTTLLEGDSLLSGIIRGAPFVRRVGAATSTLNPSTTRAGSGSLCFKDDNAQTVGHLAPGCEDERSGLAPANPSRLRASSEATPMRSAIGRRIGLCQLPVKHGIKPPTGRSTPPEHPQRNYVKEPRRTGNRARDLRNLGEGIVLLT